MVHDQREGFRGRGVVQVRGGVDECDAETRDSVTAGRAGMVSIGGRGHGGRRLWSRGKTSQRSEGDRDCVAEGSAGALSPVQLTNVGIRAGTGGLQICRETPCRPTHAAV